jgi:hypothetical protein
VGIIEKGKEILWKEIEVQNKEIIALFILFFFFNDRTFDFCGNTNKSLSQKYGKLSFPKSSCQCSLSSPE